MSLQMKEEWITPERFAEMYEKGERPDHRLIFKVSGKDPLALLPLFYCLPEEFVRKRKVYLDLPRYAHEALRSTKWLKEINTDKFLELVWDVTAWVAWQFMEVPLENGTYRKIPGYMKNYSGDSVVWKLAYALLADIQLRLKSVGYSLPDLYKIPPNVQMKWFSYKEFAGLLSQWVPEIVKEKNYQPIIDEAWNNKTLEDFDEFHPSYVQTDFQRKWYHKRNKKKTVSLEEYQEEHTHLDEDMIFEIADPRAEYEANLIEEIDLQKFYETLTDKDKIMLQMRQEQYGLQEIAETVGYKTHSAVSKRLLKLGEMYEDFVQQAYQQYLEIH